MESILNKFSEFVIVYDENKIIKFANNELLSKLGYTLQEVIENNIDIILTDINSKLEYQDDILEGNSKTFELYTKEENILLIEGNMYLENFYDKKCYFIIGKEKKQLALENMKLEDEKLKLEEALKIESGKNEFFANISHEFKTPLNIILGTMQLIKKNIEQENITYETLSKHTNIIKQNSYRLLRLVNNLIDISRIDKGYYELNLSNQNIVKIVEDITLSVADYVENRNIDLIFDTEVEEVMIACDPDKIERVLLNILSNATKYTPNGGKIEVKLVENNNKVSVSIKDNGIGIPEEKLEEIFDRFGQVQSSLSRTCEGSGIGLSLVKSILNLHGGNIEVFSEVGDGSEFIFELPIKLLKENINAVEYDNSDYHIEKCNIEFSDIYS